MEHNRITVKASGTYEVIIGNDLLGKTEEYISLTPKNWILSSPLSLDNTSLFIAGILQIFK